MARNLRCRLGKHIWRSKGRGDALTYFCQVCGKTRDKPRRRERVAQRPLCRPEGMGRRCSGTAPTTVGCYAASGSSATLSGMRSGF